LSTLRYADRAKQIKNKAIVNEDPNVKLVRGLKEEIAALKKALAGGGGGGGEAGSTIGMSAEEKKKAEEEMRKQMEDEMKAFQAKLVEMQKEKEASWEERLKQTQANANSLDSGAAEKKKKAASTPHILNLHEDDLFNKKIIHLCPVGITSFGRKDADPKPDVVVGGLSIKKAHCSIMNNKGKCTLNLLSPDAKVVINGTSVTKPTVLKERDRILIGNNHMFFYVDPAARKKMGSSVPPDPSFEEAQHEVHQAAMAATLEAEKKRKEDQARLKAETEKKVKEMEAKMEAQRLQAEKRAKKERERIEAEMLAKLKEREAELQKGGMSADALSAAMKEQEERMKRDAEAALKSQADKMAALERQLQDKIKQTEELAAQQQRRMQERSLLDERLLHTIPLVNEANAIADELGNPHAFAIKLMATRGVGGKDKTDIFVRVQLRGTDAPPLMWSLEKFTDRLYLMRELYQSFCEADRNIDAVRPEKVQDDPFYDEPTDQLIGKANVYLDSLSYFLDVDESTPIIDYKGKQKGEVSLQIVPVPLSPAGKELSVDTLSDESLEAWKGKKLRVDINVSGCRGLPPKLSTDVYVKYRWFVDEEYTCTKKATGKSINPVINDSASFEHIVTDELIKFTSGQSIELEVYGAFEDAGAVMKAALSDGAVPKSARLSNATADLSGASGGDELIRVKSERDRLAAEVKQLRAQLKDAQEQAGSSSGGCSVM